MLVKANWKEVWFYKVIYAYLADTFYDSVIVDGVDYYIADRVVVETTNYRIINGKKSVLIIIII